MEQRKYTNEEYKFICELLWGDLRLVLINLEKSLNKEI